MSNGIDSSEHRDNRTAIFDSQLLRSGLAIDELAGQSGATIEELERAFRTHDFSHLNVRAMKRLEVTLGVDLYERRSKVPDGLTAKIGAYLAERSKGSTLDELVAVFEVKPETAKDSIRSLRRDLAELGMTILQCGQELRVAPDADVAAEVARLETWTLSEFSDEELRVVMDVWVGEVQERPRRLEDFVATDQELVMSLVDRGILIPTGDDLRLFPTVFESLDPLHIAQIPYREFRVCEEP